jgi:hypothetical protein
VFVFGGLLLASATSQMEKSFPQGSQSVQLSAEFSLSGLRTLFTTFPRISSFADLLPYLALLGALFGVWMVFSPLWSYIIAQRTFYAVTNHRALMLEGNLFGGMRVRSFSPQQLEQFEKLERMDGSGSLLFSSELYQTTETVNTRVSTYSSSHGHSNPEHTHVRSSIPVTRVRRIGFIDIPNVSTAEQALYQLSTRT